MTIVRSRTANRAIPLEAQEQERLIERVALHRAKYPLLQRLYAIPNGGYRRPREAAALQRQGVRSGIPDFCLPVARGGYFGWYGELKRIKDGVLRRKQAECLAMLREDGYHAEWYAGEEAMWTGLIKYIEMEPTASLLVKGIFHDSTKSGTAG